MSSFAECWLPISFCKDFSSEGLQQLWEGILSPMFPDIPSWQTELSVVYLASQTFWCRCLFCLSCFILHCMECGIFPFCESRTKICSLTLASYRKQDKHLLKTWCWGFCHTEDQGGRKPLHFHNLITLRIYP